jgi:succinate-acetate transporter protein
MSKLLYSLLVIAIVFLLSCIPFILADDTLTQCLGGVGIVISLVIIYLLADCIHEVKKQEQLKGD